MIYDISHLPDDNVTEEIEKAIELFEILDSAREIDTIDLIIDSDDTLGEFG